MDDDESKIAEKYEALRSVMDEQMRRLWAATEARALGYGGVSTVARALGLTRPTITAGMKELGDARGLVPMAPKHRVRREGAGRPRATDSDVGLRPALEELVEPATRGHPMSPLRWTCKSVRTLAAELTRHGHTVSHQTVSEVLQHLGYSLQANRKTREGSAHPDRNAQFEHIAQRAKEFQRRAQPVISVDTKKKELVGDFRNAGQEWHPAGQPPAVRVHDFKDDELGKAIPYGSPMASTTSAPTPVGSVWGSTTTHRSLLSNRSTVGGARWAARPIPRHASCSSPPTAGAATARARGFGK